jgi:predicted extracellular nuclease
MNIKQLSTLTLSILIIAGCRRSADPADPEKTPPTTMPVACPTSDAARVCDLQFAESPLHPTVGDPIQLSSVLVTTPTITVSSKDGAVTVAGFYVQDTEARDALGGQYSGILVTYYPADLVGDGPPTIGSIVTVDGAFSQFGAEGFAKQNQVQASRVTDSGQSGEIKPITISDITKIGRGGPEAPAYEGVLVRVESVSITNTEVQINNMNYFSSFEVENILIVSGSWYRYSQPLVQENFTSLTGILRLGTAPFDAGEYLLSPRFMGDVLAQNSAQVVTSISDIQNPSAPGHPLEGCVNNGSGTDGKCARAELDQVVVTGAGGYVSRNLRSLWVQDPNATDPRYSGVKIVYNPNQTTYVPEIGHTVNVEGEIIEYYSGTQIQYPTITRQGTTTASIAATVVANVADVGRSNAEARQWEGVLVSVQNVAVTTSCIEDSRGRDHGNWVVTGDVLIGTAFQYDYNGDFRSSDINCLDANEEPTGLCGCNTPSGGTSRPNDLRLNGDSFTSITGIVDYSYGDYQLMIRGDSDIVKN